MKAIGKLALMAAITVLAADARAEISLLVLAKRGDAEAQYLVGTAYLEGREVPRDPSEAVRWLRHATSQGHTKARFALATLYREGRGVPQNYPAAARLFRDGAAAQHRRSQLALAEMLAAGQGVERDDATALQLLNQAAWANLPEAQAQLGEWLYHGRAIEKRRDTAWLVLKLSGDAIRPEGRRILEEIDRELDETTRSSLLRSERNYRVKHPKLVEPASPLRHLPVIAREKPATVAEGDPEEATALSPEALARLDRAELLVATGVREGDAALVAEAVAIADELLGEHPSNARALLVRARGDITEGRLAEAIERLRAAVAERPGWAEAHFWLGSTLERRGELPEARDEFTHALRLDVEQIEARAALARIHVALGDREAASMQARLYLAEEPDDAATRAILVESLVVLGRESDALRMLQAIREEDRDAAVWAAMGRIYLDLGQTRNARESLIRANAGAPHQPETLRALLQLDAADGRLPESVERIDAALALRPDVAALHRLAAIAALHGGRSADAERSFERALELDPSDVESYLLLARHYTESGRDPELIPLYERALRAAPDSAVIQHRLGEAYESRGDRERAIGRYEAAIQRDPGYGPAKDDLARLLADDPETAGRAFSLAEEARALMPNEPGPAVTLGKLYLARGELLAAIRYFQRAEAGLATEDPRRGEVRYLLGRSYVTDGQVARGRETLKRALAEIEDRGDPTEPPWAAEAREMLARYAAPH
ncbi:MAG: tetratricopeptide repeat protein [Myxococcales bacterium]|nr:tetratricopeptide repeat protein [Myxococcales bacterium]